METVILACLNSARNSSSVALVLREHQSLLDAIDNGESEVVSTRMVGAPSKCAGDGR